MKRVAMPLLKVSAPILNCVWDLSNGISVLENNLGTSGNYQNVPGDLDLLVCDAIDNCILNE